MLGSGLLVGLAGCVGGNTTTPTTTATDQPRTTVEPTLIHAGDLEPPLATNGDFPTDDDPADGYPPDFGDRPDTPSANPSSFETLEVNGESIRLVPIDIAIAWYQRRSARFVDARGPTQYEHAHVYGAVNSPARTDSAGGPVPGWPRDARIVTYCGCPHHLSSIRAAGLLKAEYGSVYALDDGFVGTADAWAERGYPMAGRAFREETSTRVARITGAVDSRHAGDYVWATAGTQYEAARIGPDGRYDLELRFVDVDGSTLVTLRTPGGTEVRPLDEFSGR